MPRLNKLILSYQIVRSPLTTSGKKKFAFDSSDPFNLYNSNRLTASGIIFFCVKEASIYSGYEVLRSIIHFNEALHQILFDLLLLNSLHSKGSFNCYVKVDGGGG